MPKRLALISTSRDLRVDFFRGLALWWIFVDHIGADWLNRLSLRNFALCDATEVFVLLAGYAGAIAYGRTMDRHGWPYAAADVIRRAWTLYVAHIFLFMVFAVQVTYSATALDRADFLDEIHLDVLGNNPYRALLEALILRFQPAYMNILPLYIVLLLIFAAALPLLRRPAVLAGLSLSLYGMVRVLDISLPSWTGGTWFFNPLAWQLLFILGAILSYAPIRPPARPRLVDAAAMGMVLFGLVEQWVIFAHPNLTAHLPARLAHGLLAVDKEGLHPFRLASILALTWLTVRLVPADAGWIRSRLAAPFVLCGQHSLPVFCSGIFLSFLGRLVFEQTAGWPMQVAVNGAGALLLVMVGAIAAWYRAKGRQSRVLPAPLETVR